MFVPFPFSSLTLSRFLRFLPPSPQFHPSPSLSSFVFVSESVFWFHCFPFFSPLLVFSFFVSTFLIEKMIAFTLHGSSGPGGLRRFSSSQKGPCPAGETLPSFSAVESAATNPSPPFPGGSPSVKRGDPSHLSNINI